MSRRWLCVSCWRRLPAGELRYRPAEAQSDLPEWMRPPRVEELRPLSELGRRGLGRLLAEDDGPVPEGVTPYCACGQPLTARAALAGGEEMGLGFAGPRSSGKTLLTLTAVRELNGHRIGGEPVGLLGIGPTAARFRALTHRLFDEHRRPEPTLPEAARTRPGEGDQSNFCWEVFAGRSADRLGLLTVYDLAGETWRLPSHERRERLDRYLGLLTSLVLLVDGAAVGADLGLDARDAWVKSGQPAVSGAEDEEWLSAILDRIGARSREVDLAITLSKADLLWDEPAWRALRPADGGEAAVAEEGVTAAGGEPPDDGRREAIAEALDRSGRGGLVRAAESHFRSVELFAVSSLGFRPAPADVGEDDSLLRPVSPRGVVEPLVWLLGQRLRELAPAR